jgi:hypothetical protein
MSLMERVPFAVMLTIGSIAVLVRQCRLWSARHAATSRRDRVLTRGAPAYGVCCALVAVLGIEVIVYAVTGVGLAVFMATLAVTGLAVVVTLVLYGVVWWRERPAPVVGPPTAVPPPAPTAGWVPPTPQAAAMLESRGNGGPAAICSAIALEPLLFVVGRQDAEEWFTEPGPLPLRGTRSPDGRFHLTAYTEGGVPRVLASDVVLRSETLDAQVAALAEQGTLEVDPGTPQHVSVSITVVQRWVATHPGDLGRREHGRLRAIEPVSTTEPLDHGLACAAWHAVMNGIPWNRFGPRGYDQLAARIMMRDAWGIDSARDWQLMLDRLADPQPFGGDVVFDLRRQIGDGAFVPLDAVEALVEAPENVEGNGRALSDRVLADLRRTEAYEGYLREHGVLTEREQVHSLLAWDIGRGAMLARYGLDADYCDESTARWQLERFGLLARRCYDSWPEFGAALVLGRLLWTADLDDAELDDEAYDAERCIEPFTILTRETTSPWRTVPFHPALPAESAPATPEAS